MCSNENNKSELFAVLVLDESNKQIRVLCEALKNFSRLRFPVFRVERRVNVFNWLLLLQGSKAKQQLAILFCRGQTAINRFQASENFSLVNSSPAVAIVL